MSEARTLLAALVEECVVGDDYERWCQVCDGDNSAHTEDCAVGIAQRFLAAPAPPALLADLEALAYAYHQSRLSNDAPEFDLDYARARMRRVTEQIARAYAGEGEPGATVASGIET